MMRDGAWYDAASWFGIDADLQSVATAYGRCEDVLRCIDVSPFDVYDIDPFANPYQALWIIGQRMRRDARRVGVLLTDGGGAGFANLQTTFRAAGWSRQMMDAMGVRPSDKRSGLKGRGSNIVAQTMVRSWIGDIERWWSAKNSTGTTFYYGAIVSVSTERPGMRGYPS